MTVPKKRALASIFFCRYNKAMNIAASTEKQTFLNSLLNESAFGKIQSAINLNEEGVWAEAAIKPGAENAVFTPDLRFSFKPFRFEGTEAEKQSGQVLFTGKGFGGRPLLGIMQASDKAQKARALYAYSACVRQAILEEKWLPANGAGGILFNQTKNKITILFLPQDIFEFAAHNANNDDYAFLQAAWQDKNLSGARAAAFVRAALVYQALSGQLPFPAASLEERQADILDARYLPLKNVVNGANEKLSQQISYALEYGSAAFEQKLQESGLSQRNAQRASGASGSSPKIEWLDKDFCLDELAAELGLQADGNVHGVERKSAVSQKEFEEAAKKLLGKKSAKAKASRSLRRNRALFVTGIFLIAGSLFFGRSVHNDKLGRPTTISLTDRQTAEAFFSGFHSMNTILMQAASKGSQAKKLVDSTSSVYVASKMRDAFSQTVGTVTPEIYIYRSDLEDKWIYGITNFELGESSAAMTQADNRKSAPTLKQKPVPLNIKNGTESQLCASYYRVHNEGPESGISVEKVFGTVMLAFVKNRWLVTGFDLNESQSACPINEFLQDRKAALDECGGDALLAAKKLKEKYEWIPSDKEMAAARIEIETRMAQND